MALRGLYCDIKVLSTIKEMYFSGFPDDFIYRGIRDDNDNNFLKMHKIPMKRKVALKKIKRIKNKRRI